MLSFAINFGIKFSSFRFDSEPGKYLSNIFDPILLMQYIKALGLEVKNEDKKI